MSGADWIAPGGIRLKWFSHPGVLLPTILKKIVLDQRQAIEDAFVRASDVAKGEPLVLCMFSNGLLGCTATQADSNRKEMGLHVRPVFPGVPPSQHVLWVMLEFSSQERYALQLNIAVDTIKINSGGGSA